MLTVNGNLQAPKIDVTTWPYLNCNNVPDFIIAADAGRISTSRLLNVVFMLADMY